ncbi:MAG: sulfotransferase family protein [Egibacteraceae bacterium]
MLNVIGAGFGRTGNTSLRAALETLGFPCYHMFDVFAQPGRARLWEAAADGQPVEWEEIFNGYQAAVDWPAVSFWRELVDAYPDAKVVLSVRDPQRWYESMDRTILHAARQIGAPGFESSALAKLVTPELQRMLYKVVFQRSFGVRAEGREQIIEVFERHNQEVRRHVQAERLLVYEVTQGWEPLCAFLGVPVPAGRPFPHLNDAQFWGMGPAFFQSLLKGLTLPAEVGAGDPTATGE